MQYRCFPELVEKELNLEQTALLFLLHKNKLAKLKFRLQKQLDASQNRLRTEFHRKGCKSWQISKMGREIIYEFWQ